MATETLEQWRARTGRAPVYAGIDGRARDLAEHKATPPKAVQRKAPKPIADPSADAAEDRRHFAEQYEGRERKGAPVPQAGVATLTAALEMRRLRTGEDLAAALDALGHVLACYAAGLDAPPPRLWSRRAIERADKAEQIAAAAARAAAAETAAAKAAADAADARAELDLARRDAAAEHKDTKQDPTRRAVARFLAGELNYRAAAATATSSATFARAVREARAAGLEIVQ